MADDDAPTLSNILRTLRGSRKRSLSERPVGSKLDSRRGMMEANALFDLDWMRYASRRRRLGCARQCRDLALKMGDILCVDGTALCQTAASPQESPSCSCIARTWMLRDRWLKKTLGGIKRDGHGE